MVASRKSQVASRKSQVASRKSQVASRKSQVASSKLLSFLTLLSLFFSSPTFAASSSSLGASALGEISIGLSDDNELATLAAECLDIIAYENTVPDICADFIEESLEIAVNSSYRFEEQRPEVRGSGNSQTIAAQINYDAKQSYLLSKEEVEAAKQTAKSLGYNPNELVFVSASTTDGVSVRHKGFEVASSESKATTKKNTAFWTTLVLAAAAVVAAEMIGGSHSSTHSEENPRDPEPARTCDDDPNHQICLIKISNEE